MAYAAGIACADAGLLGLDAAFSLGAAALALAAAALRGPRARAALACALAFAAGAAALSRQLEAAARWDGSPARTLTVEGVVRGRTRGAAGVWLDLESVVGVDASEAPPPPRVRVLAGPEPEQTAALAGLAPGDRLRARLRLAPPAGLRNPGGFDSARALRRAGVGAQGHLVHPDLVVRLARPAVSAPRRVLARIRERLAQRLERAGPGGPLLAALALGERAGLAPELGDAFAALGLSHLLSVSGLHLGLVAAGVFAAARALLSRSPRFAARRDPRVAALAIACAAAAAYALLAGWGAPVRRSLVLLAGLLVSVAAARPAPPLQPLALAALLLLAAEPEALFAPGAQLSYAASGALAWAARSGGRAGQRLGALGASAVALAATGPLAALELGSRAPLALLANAAAVPWTAVALLPASAAAAVLAALPGAAAAAALGLCERLAAASLAAVLAAARALPGAAHAPPPAPAWLALAAGLGLAAVRTRAPAARIALAAATSLLLAAAPAAPVAPPPPRALLLDVGQGDSSLVEAEGSRVLIDGGTAVPGGADLGRSAVVPALRALGVAQLDLVVASHADLDHRGGLPAVLEALPVAALWLPRGGLADADFEALRAAARARGVPVLERGRGDPELALPGLRVAPLWPPAGASGLSRNDRSLVVRVDAGGRRLLFPGDIEAAGEAALLASGADLRADVVKLAHHGSRTSSTAAFLAATGASVGVVSAPCAGHFGMPHAAAVGRARAAGLALWWTGRDGAVRVGLAETLRVFGSGPPRACPRSG